jgi:hypothetical protein
MWSRHGLAWGYDSRSERWCLLVLRVRSPIPLVRAVGDVSGEFRFCQQLREQSVGVSGGFQLLLLKGLDVIDAIHTRIMTRPHGMRLLTDTPGTDQPETSRHTDLRIKLSRPACTRRSCGSCTPSSPPADAHRRLTEQGGSSSWRSGRAPRGIEEPRLPRRSSWAAPPVVRSTRLRAAGSNPIPLCRD